MLEGKARAGEIQGPEERGWPRKRESESDTHTFTHEPTHPLLPSTQPLPIHPLTHAHMYWRTDNRTEVGWGHSKDTGETWDYLFKALFKACSLWGLLNFRLFSVLTTVNIINETNMIECFHEDSLITFLLLHDVEKNESGISQHRFMLWIWSRTK